MQSEVDLRNVTSPIETPPDQPIQRVSRRLSSVGSLSKGNPYALSTIHDLGDQIVEQEHPAGNPKTPSSSKGQVAYRTSGGTSVGVTNDDSSKHVPKSPIEEASIPQTIDASGRTEEKGAAPMMKADADRQERRKVYAVQATASTIKLWQEKLLPHLERVLEHHLPKKESASIDLLGIGTSRENSRPTIVITCQSVRKLKCYLQNHFCYDEGAFDLKIRKGDARRSTGRRAREIRNPRCARRLDGLFVQDCPNRAYQEKPLSGASIGACLNGRPLPPGTYGGLILVDGQPFGMTVHHLLDPESEEDGEGETDEDDGYTSHALGDDEHRGYQDDSEGFNLDDSPQSTLSPSGSDVSPTSIIIYQNRT